MELKYSPEFEDLIFATRFLPLKLNYKKEEKEIKLVTEEEEFNNLKDILNHLKTLSEESGFLTENCVQKIVRKRLSPAPFNTKLLESIDQDKLTFFDAVIFARAYKFFVEEKHINQSFLPLFLQIQEKFYEKKKFIKFEPGKFIFDIKAGTIKEIREANNSDKLFVEQVLVEKERQIVSGLRDKFTDCDLLEKTFLFLVNIKSRKVAGNLSEGMILCAKDGDLLEVLSTSGKNGSRLTYGEEEGFFVVETYDIPVFDLQSEKGKMFFESVSVKEGVLCFKESPLFCDGKVVLTEKVKNGNVS